MVKLTMVSDVGYGEVKESTLYTRRNCYDFNPFLLLLLLLLLCDPILCL